MCSVPVQLPPHMLLMPRSAPHSWLFLIVGGCVAAGAIVFLLQRMRTVHLLSRIFSVVLLASAGACILGSVFVYLAYTKPYPGILLGWYNGEAERLTQRGCSLDGLDTLYTSSLSQFTGHNPEPFIELGVFVLGYVLIALFVVLHRGSGTHGPLAQWLPLLRKQSGSHR